MAKHIEVTDHALLRYIDRVKGVDLELLREEIRAIVAPGLGGDKLRVNGISYILDGNCVITLGAGQFKQNTRQPRYRFRSKRLTPDGRVG